MYYEGWFIVPKYGQTVVLEGNEKYLGLLLLVTSILVICYWVFKKIRVK